MPLTNEYLSPINRILIHYLKIYFQGDIWKPVLLIDQSIELAVLVYEN